MTNINDINIKISADDSQAILAFNRTTGSMKKMESDTGGIIGKMQKHWLAYSAAVLAAYATIRKAWDFAERAAQFEEQKTSLNILAAQYNTTASTIISSIQGASQGMISMADAADIAGTALMKNLQPQQIIELASAAETLSNISGQKVVDSFRNMTEAIALGRERALENTLGIIDLNARYGDMINKLSDVEKAKLRYALVMEKVRDIQQQMGQSILSVSDKMEQFRVTIDNWKNTAGVLLVKIGAAFINVFAGIGAAANWGIGQALNTLGTLLEKIQEITRINLGGAALKEIGQGFLEGSKYGEQLAKQAHDIFINFGKIESKNIPKIIRDIGRQGAIPASEAIQKLNQQIQDMIDKSTLSSAALIQKQADAWLKAGADKIKVQQWVDAEILKLNTATWEAYIRENIKYQEYMLSKEKEYQEEQIKIQREANELFKQEQEFKVQMYEDSWRQMFDIANQVGGEAGQGLGQMFAGMKSMMDIDIGQDPYTQRMDALRELYIKHLEDQKLISNEEVLLWKQKERDKQQIELESLLSMAGMEAEINNLRLQNTITLEQQKLSMTLNALSIIQGALMSFGAFSAKENKAMFLLSKAIGIAMIWVQTQIAAMSAAAAVAGIPIVGPALAAAAYAKMQILGGIAMAAAAAAAIGQMATGGGGGGISGGGGYAYTSPTEPRWQQTQEKETPRPIIINYHHYGHVVDADSFSREIIPSLKKAVEDGMH